MEPLEELIINAAEIPDTRNIFEELTSDSTTLTFIKHDMNHGRHLVQTLTIK